MLKEGKERRGEREKGKVKRRKREWKSYEREERPEGGGGEDEMEREGEIKWIHLPFGLGRTAEAGSLQWLMCIRVCESVRVEWNHGGF